MLTVTSGTAIAAGTQYSSLNHIGICASDVQRSVEFYQKVFGLSVLGKDTAHESIFLGVGKSHLAIHHCNPPGTISHFAIGVDHYNRASIIEDLRQRGATAVVGTLENDLHVNDPDGLHVQIISNEAKPWTRG
jgi:catechol 2,3-dioxygenase-like lactoylglutathione lyase family enzyme